MVPANPINLNSIQKWPDLCVVLLSNSLVLGLEFRDFSQLWMYMKQQSVIAVSCGTVTELPVCSVVIQMHYLLTFSLVSTKVKYSREDLFLLIYSCLHGY